jgi:hypothetical protein
LRALVYRRRWTISTHIREIAGDYEAMIGLLIGLATTNRVHR